MGRRLLYFLGITSLVLMLASGNGFAVATMKIGMVDVARVFDEYQRTKDEDRKLEEKANRKQAEREKMVEEIRKLKEELELLSEKGREEKQVAIDEKIKRLQDFDRSAGDELRKERDLTAREILKEIQTVLKDIGQKEGFTVIMDERMTVYGDKEVSLTDRVLEGLNAKYKPGKP